MRYPVCWTVFASEPDVSAVFGAYDEAPPEPNFMSQYRNLSHSYVHQIGTRDAVTFWAGLGAVRAGAFRTVGGFDERFTRPSVEDIELGYRLTRAGYKIRLAPEFRGKHYKRWTLPGSIVIDIAARGIPWAQLLQKFRTLSNDLNTRVELRLSVAALVPAARVAGRTVSDAVGRSRRGRGSRRSTRAQLSLLPVVRRQRGLWFGIRVVPAHIVHHLCNGLSFVIGTGLFAAGRFGLVLPGALPQAVWTRSAHSPALPQSRS